MRDENNIVPADFINQMNRYVLESIATISLNQRLGLLDSTVANENAEKERMARRKIFRSRRKARGSTADLEALPYKVIQRTDVHPR